MQRNRKIGNDSSGTIALPRVLAFVAALVALAAQSAVAAIIAIHLHSRATAGTLRALTSSYALEPISNGVRLDYVGHVAPGFSLFGHVEQTAVERNIARQLQALSDEIERQSKAAQR